MDPLSSFLVSHFLTGTRTGFYPCHGPQSLSLAFPPLTNTCAERGSFPGIHTLSLSAPALATTSAWKHLAHFSSLWGRLPGRLSEHPRSYYLLSISITLSVIALRHESVYSTLRTRMASAVFANPSPETGRSTRRLVNYLLNGRSGVGTREVHVPSGYVLRVCIPKEDHT